MALLNLPFWQIPRHVNPADDLFIRIGGDPNMRHGLFHLYFYGMAMSGSGSSYPRFSGFDHTLIVRSPSNLSLEQNGQKLFFPLSQVIKMLLGSSLNDVAVIISRTTAAVMFRHEADAEYDLPFPRARVIPELCSCEMSIEDSMIYDVRPALYLSHLDLLYQPARPPAPSGCDHLFSGP